MDNVNTARQFATFTLIASAAALLTTPFLPPPAVAADNPPPSVVVRYGDLNLANESGVASLYGRIRAAAATACGRQPDGRELAQGAVWSACRDHAVARAVLTIGNPALTALQAGKPMPEQMIRLASSGQTTR